MTRQIFQSIQKGNLQELKQNPLWAENSKKQNRNLFKIVEEYKNNFMLLTATDNGHFDIVKFLIEEAKVDINQ